MGKGMTYDAPAAYERLIAPRYARIADELVNAARPRERDDVLELGAGTGLVTRRAATRVRSYVATDLSAAMLAHARATTKRRAGVLFSVVDYAGPLPFLDESFDLVLCGLTFVQALPAALQEVARVLKREGRLALSMWGPSYHEKRLLNDALGAVEGGRFPPSGTSAAVGRLERAGWRTIRRTDHVIENRFSAVEDYISYRRGFGRPGVWTPAFYERFLRAVRERAARDAAADGSLTVGWTQTVITARRPVTRSHPKPRR